MLNDIQKNILIKSIKIRLNKEENVTDIFKNYKSLTEEEKTEILSECDIDYTPTLDEIKLRKINNFSLICKQNIENGVEIDIGDNKEHFTYGIENGDQGNIDDLFNLAITTKLSQPYHSSGGTCKLYTVEQISQLYIAVKMLKAKETTYFNQLKRYIEDCIDEEIVKNISYGDELTGEYLETYNEMMEQSESIVMALVSAYAK